MKQVIKYFSHNKIKKIVLISFLLILSVNYIYGYRYSIPLIDNLVYKNTYYPLVLLWIGLVWCWHLSEKFLFKLGIILFLFSCFYQLIDKRVVAEILMSYCLLVFLTATIKLIKESISSE